MPRTKNRYIPALDGLRAFAVLAVIAYHMGLPFAQGGLLGVTVFFVLSGYLITSLLLVEWDNTKTIDLKNFWLRRVRRLFPAIALVIIVCMALFVIFDHELLTKLRRDLLPALLWFTNWWYVFADISYFEAIGAPSPVTHFWSLAIEEQFYVVWPLLLLALGKAGVGKTAQRRTTLVLAAVSAILMAVLYNPTADPSRVYYGTDTRAFSLLAGAWLAYVWPAYQLNERSGSRMARKELALFDAVGIVAFVGLLCMVVFVDDYSPLLYRGGLVLASILTATAIAVIVHPRSMFGRALGLTPFVWIGKRSYGMYLWHYPILLLMNPRNSTADPNPLYLLLQLGIIMGVSALSYHFVENPIRKGKLGEFFKSVRAGSVNLPLWLQQHAVPAVACVLVCGVAFVGCAVVPNTSALNDPNALMQQEEQQAPPPEPQPEAEEGPWKYDPLMIGDSVSLRATDAFNAQWPGGHLDAATSRQLTVGQEVYQYYSDQNLVGEHIVVALGTNGVLTEDQLEEFLTLVGADKKVYLLTIRTPNTWETSVNDAITTVAANHENVTLIDWYGASANHDEYFDGDGTHLTEVGVQAFIGLIHDAVGDTPNPPEPETTEGETTDGDTSDATDENGTEGAEGAEGSTADAEENTGDAA